MVGFTKDKIAFFMQWIDDAISKWQTKNRPRKEKQSVKQRSKKYENVYFNSKSNHWFSKIEIGGKIKYLGKFSTEEEAANAIFMIEESS